MSELSLVTKDTFDSAVLGSPLPVLLDFWGPRCIPCIQLDPFVAELGTEYQGRVNVAKVIAPENRQLCVNLRVMSLPTFIGFRDGKEIRRITGDVGRDAVRELVEGLISLTPSQ